MIRINILRPIIYKNYPYSDSLLYMEKCMFKRLLCEFIYVNHLYFVLIPFPK